MTSQAGGVNFQNQSGVYHKACTYLLCNIFGGISIFSSGVNNAWHSYWSRADEFYCSKIRFVVEKNVVEKGLGE